MFKLLLWFVLLIIAVAFLVLWIGKKPTTPTSYPDTIEQPIYPVSQEGKG